MLQVPLQAVLWATVIHSLWGGNAVAAKFGLEAFPPFWSAVIRFVFGVATVACWCWFRGHRLLPLRHEWRPLFTISLLFTLQIGLMNVGFDHTSATNGSILISINPVFAALFAHVLLSDDRLTPRRCVGLSIAFFGVMLTLQGPGAGLWSVLVPGNYGDWICLLSAAVLGYRLIASAKAMRELDPLRLALWQMLLSIPSFLVLALVFEEWRLEVIPAAAVLGLAYQGVVVAGIGFMGSLWLMSRYRASIMASFNFISPVVGVALSVWLLGETLTSATLAGVALVALGMILITLKDQAGRRRG